MARGTKTKIKKMTNTIEMKGVEAEISIEAEIIVMMIKMTNIINETTMVIEIQQIKVVVMREIRL